MPGHAFSGEVVAVGRDVRGLREGNVVAVDPSIFCGHCHHCRIGRGNLCENFDSFGVIGQNGGCAELVAVTAGRAFVMPEGIPRSWGPLIEPVSCATHGFDRLAPRIGDHVLIYGAGAIGLVLCSLAVHQAAGSVSVVTTRRRGWPAPRRRAPITSPSARSSSTDPRVGRSSSTRPGSPAAQEDALRPLRRGGTFLVFGVADKDAMASFSPFRVYNDELTIIGSMATLHSFERARDIVAAGIIDGAALITDRVALEDYNDAVAAFRRGDGLKIQVTPSR